MDALVGVACRAAAPIAGPEVARSAVTATMSHVRIEPTHPVRWQTAAERRSGCIRPDQGHRCSCLAQELLGDVSDLPAPRRALAVRRDDQQVTGPQGSHDFGRGRSGADLGRDRQRRAPEAMPPCASRYASGVSSRGADWSPGWCPRITLCSRSLIVTVTRWTGTCSCVARSVASGNARSAAREPSSATTIR